MNKPKKLLSLVCSLSILVVSLATCTLFASAAQSNIHIEAESGKLYGTAQIASNNNASGGKFIREINLVKGYGNKVVYNIPRCAAGTYRFQMRYVSATNGSIRYQVDNGSILVMAFTLNMGNDWNWGPKSAAVLADKAETVTLKGDGTDTLMIQDGSPTGFAWVDWIELVPVKVSGTVAVASTPANTAAAASTAVSSQAAVSSEVSSAISSAESSSSETSSAVSETNSSSKVSAAPASSSSNNGPLIMVIVIGSIIVLLGAGAIATFLVMAKKKLARK